MSMGAMLTAFKGGHAERVALYDRGYGDGQQEREPQNDESDYVDGYHDGLSGRYLPPPC